MFNTYTFSTISIYSVFIEKFHPDFIMFPRFPPRYFTILLLFRKIELQQSFPCTKVHQPLFLIFPFLFPEYIMEHNIGNNVEQFQSGNEKRKCSIEYKSSSSSPFQLFEYVFISSFNLQFRSHGLKSSEFL